MDVTTHYIETSRLKQKLMWRFVMLLSVFVVMLVVSYLFASKIISDKEYDGLVLNAAGLQRMRVRQYTSEIYQTLVSIAANDLQPALENKKKSDITSSLFDKTMETFLNGGALSVRMTNTSEIKYSDYAFDSHYDDVYYPGVKEKNIREHIEMALGEWNELKRIALLSLRSNPRNMTGNPYVKQLQGQASITVLHVDHVVSLMQYYSEMKLKDLDLLLLSLLVIGILVFIFITYFVYFNIVNPLGVLINRVKQTSENLENEKQRAEEANAAKSEFLSSMSHELRTPLNAILGFAQMLQINSGNMSQVQLSNVDEILEAGNHLLSLVNEVLDLEKIGSGNIDIDFEKVCMDDVIQESIALIKPHAKQKNIEIIDNVSGKDLCVIADTRRLKQVVVNLLSNAEKYNKLNGKIEIVAEVTNNDLCIKITDSGEGMQKEDLSKLFVPFERLDKKYNVEGTGIGLVVTKNLVELMCGSIGVESESGKGSTFWVQFPQA